MFNVHHFCLKIDPEKQRIIIVTKSARGLLFPLITMLCHKSKLKWIFLCLNFDSFCCLNQGLGTTNLVGWTKKEDIKSGQNQNKQKKTQKIK